MAEKNKAEKKKKRRVAEEKLKNVWAEKNVFGLKKRAHVNQKKRKGGLKQK